MVGPRDAINTNAVPVNNITGLPVSERQAHHLAAILKAGDALYVAMHEAEGSAPPDGPFQEHHFQTRRMNIAATQLETTLMFARKAALESK